MPAERSFSFDDQAGHVDRRAVALGRDRAGIDVGEAEDGMQHGRLAGAVRPDQAERLAAADPQVEAVQNLHLAVAGVQVVDAQMRLVTGQRVELLDRTSRAIAAAWRATSSTEMTVSTPP